MSPLRGNASQSGPSQAGHFRLMAISFSLSLTTGRCVPGALHPGPRSKPWRILKRSPVLLAYPVVARLFPELAHSSCFSNNAFAERWDII
jgi:hypothetical protein